MSSQADSLTLNGETIPNPIPDDVIYLDYHATTPTDPRVVEAMKPYFSEQFANPSSPHALGRRSKKVVENARETVAKHIGAFKGEVIFTSGATESNNLTLQGLARNAKRNNRARHRILTSAIEHKSVLNTAKYLTNEGFEHEKIPVDEGGILKLDRLEEMLSSDVLLVSVMAANNEIGTIQPIQEAAELAHEHGALFHCDAAQAFGRMDIQVKEWDVDFLSMSAHKGYGPKGIGLLYIRGGPTQQPIDAIYGGGGQEKQLRSGTHNLPAIVGLQEACELIEDGNPREADRMSEMRNQLEESIITKTNSAEVVGDKTKRLPSTTSIHIPDIESEALIARLDNIEISSGSACESGAPEPSHVLLAVGFDRQQAYEYIRLAVGRFTHEEYIELVATEISSGVRRILESGQKC